MNSNYLYEYSSLFERVLSVAHYLHYSTATLERLISYSPYFQNIENDKNSFPPITNDKTLINSLFYDQTVNIEEIPIYNQCLWAAEAYLRIQEATSLTFEAIFLYMPISKMYSLFPIYHEMDFSQIINEFNILFNKESTLSILLKKYNYSLKDISIRCNISYATLFSLKQRKRDIKKANTEICINLAKIFNVRVETIAEIKI